jgi:hypothetical protein
MADKKVIKVLEYPVGGIAELRTWDSPVRTSRPWGQVNQIAVIDCFILPSMPNSCQDPKNTLRWQRLRKLGNFHPTQPAKVKDISKIMLDTANNRYEIFNRDTLQSLVYLPDNNELYLYSSPIDSGVETLLIHQPYFDLLPRDPDGEGLSIVWIIWGALLIMFGVVIWVMKKGSRSFM